MKFLFNLYFQIFAMKSGNSIYKKWVYCIAFHIKVINCDPNLYFPFFVFTKTCVVIRKLLCELLGVDCPTCSQKHFRIIDWKMILVCLNNDRLLFAMQHSLSENQT